eukprot:4102582-Amphidinium_carterae.1
MMVGAARGTEGVKLVKKTQTAPLLEQDNPIRGSQSLAGKRKALKLGEVFVTNQKMPKHVSKLPGALMTASQPAPCTTPHKSNVSVSHAASEQGRHNANPAQVGDHCTMCIWVYAEKGTATHHHAWTHCKKRLNV